MAGEVENPKYTYPAVVAFLLPLVIALNVMPFAVALSLDPDTEHYDAGYFGTLAGQLSGLWLKTLFVVGANMAQVGLYHSQVIAAERSCGAFVHAYLSDLGFTCLLPLNREAPPPSRLTPRMNEPPLEATQTPMLHRRCLASLTLWLKTEPEGGGMSRANVLFNATIAGCLTQVHPELISSAGDHPELISSAGDYPELTSNAGDHPELISSAGDRHGWPRIAPA